MSEGERFAGWLSDGRVAAHRDVVVTLTQEGIALAAVDGTPIEVWPYHAVSLRAEELRKGPVRLGRGDQRLTVDDPAFGKALNAATPHLRVALFAVIGGVWWGIPHLAQRIVEHIPPAWEANLAEGTEDQPWLGGRCTGTAGQAALDALTKRLTKGIKSPYPLKVSVRDSGTVNAFALPGGHIVLLRGLLKGAESPDEVAGVLAHELTHALNRHPMRALVANSGVALLFEVTIGGGTGASIGVLLTTLSYTRSMEAEADDGALMLLRRAGISTDGFAAFFKRMEKRSHGGLPAYLSTHPPDAERIAAVEAQAFTGTKPALSDKEWRALKSICGPAGKDKNDKDKNDKK
jgi:beta-barrel assembly-enhancing protease